MRAICRKEREREGDHENNEEAWLTRSFILSVRTKIGGGGGGGQRWGSWGYYITFHSPRWVGSSCGATATEEFNSDDDAGACNDKERSFCKTASCKYSIY